MKLKRDIFTYNWSKAKCLGDVLFMLRHEAEAIQLSLDDGDLVGLTEEDVGEIAQALEGCANLKALSLSQCGLTPEELRPLIAGLRSLQNLESLDLSHNAIGDKGIEAICHLVQDSPTLIHLNVSYCSFSSSGGHCLVDLLENNNVLRSLVFDGSKEVAGYTVAQIFETALRSSNIINLSALNSYCKIQDGKKFCSVLRRSQTLLSIGFPTFYRRKPQRGAWKDVSIESIFDEEVSGEDVLAFESPQVQKIITENLKLNVSLLTVFNRIKKSKSELKFLLKRNNDYVKSCYNDSLRNGQVNSAKIFTKKAVILGRRGSGKTLLLNQLFGENNVETMNFFELSLTKKEAAIVKEGIKYHLRELSPASRENLTLKAAAKWLTKTLCALPSNEKFKQFDRMYRGVRKPKGRAGRFRNYYQVPNQNRGRRQRNQPVAHGNSLLRSYRNNRERMGNRMSHKHREIDDFSFSDSDSGSSTDSESLSMKSVRPRKETNELPKVQIQGDFDIETLARYGNNFSPTQVLVTAREVSNKYTNNRAKVFKAAVRGSRATQVSVRTNISASLQSTKAKYSNADRFGTVNASLVDLNNMIYGMKKNDGIYIVTSNLQKLLKYIRVEEGRMIVNNPISVFIKTTLRAINACSKHTPVFLVGTHYMKESGELTSKEELLAASKLLEVEIKNRFGKKIIRNKPDKKTVLWFHPIDLVQENSVQSLKTEVYNKLFKSNGMTDEKIPVKYLKVLDAVRKWKKNMQYNFISKERLMELTLEMGVEKEKELDQILKLLADRNEIIIFPKSDFLKDFIVLNKSFLYFCMYQILNRNYLKRVLSSKSSLRALKAQGLGRDLLLFNSKKLLSRNLIEFMWRTHNHYIVERKISSESYYDQNIAGYLYVLEIMKRAMFVTEWTTSTINQPLPSNSFNGMEVYFLASPLMKNHISKSQKGNQILRNIKSFKDSKGSLRRSTGTGKQNVRNSPRGALSRGNSLRSRLAEVEPEKPEKPEKSQPKSKDSELRRKLKLGKGVTFKKQSEAETAKSAKKLKKSKPVKGKNRNRRSAPRRSLERLLRRANPSGKTRGARPKESNRGTAIKSHSSGESSPAPKQEIASDRSERSSRKPNTQHQRSAFMQETAKRQSKAGKTPSPNKPRYLLDRSKPVTALLDFKDSFASDGLFLRLCALMYDKCFDMVNTKEDLLPHAIENVDLYRNYFKLTFDRMVSNKPSDVDNDLSTIDSVFDSEFESISVAARRNTTVTQSTKAEERGYLMLHFTDDGSYVMVIRDHDHAPVYLKMLMESLNTARNEEALFFKVPEPAIKLEVKNNKFLIYRQAEEKSFAPWFAKNKLIKRKRTMRKEYTRSIGGRPLRSPNPSDFFESDDEDSE